MSTKPEGLGDEQGTRVGSPDQSGSISPAQHNDGPSGRPEVKTGAGQEATIAHAESQERDGAHRSGYGGKGGKPDTSSEKR
ncbi:hypothetical protein BH09GEM1_BH09GEM1_25340 [soil metagenome]